MAIKWDEDAAKQDHRFKSCATAVAGLTDKLSALEGRMTAAETKNRACGLL